MSIATTFEALNRDSVQEYRTVDERAYKTQQRFLRKLAVLVFKGIALVFILGFVIANPELIPLAIIAGIGWNEYYKMQRKSDGTHI